MRNKTPIKKKQRKGKYLPLAFFFLIGVLSLILIAFLWRLIILISQSTFDNTHQYIVSVISTNNAKILSFMPDNHTISIVTITGKFDSAVPGRALEVPLNGRITGEIKEDIRSFLKNHILSVTKENSDMNAIDIVRLWWYSKTVPPNRITEDVLSLPADQNTQEEKLQRIFMDKTIYQEAKTIKIINATGIEGYGNRLSKLLQHIGSDVIIVMSSDNPVNLTTITYVNELSYTVKRIEKILQIQAVQEIKKPIIADITITIGKDMIGNKVF